MPQLGRCSEGSADPFIGQVFYRKVELLDQYSACFLTPQTFRKGEKKNRLVNKLWITGNQETAIIYSIHVKNTIVNGHPWTGQ